LDSFQAAVDDSFRVHLDATSSVVLTLDEVAVSDRQPGWESFSLLFLGPRPAFAQAQYAVEHPAMGSFELFLVPIQSNGDQQHYEAIFNRPLRDLNAS